MASLSTIGFCLVLLPCTFAATYTTSAALLSAATRSNNEGGLRSTRALHVLDVNKDGRVEPSEVEAFAHSEGLESASATDDFSAIDSNGDGVLDASELLQVVGSPGAPSTAGSPLATRAKPAAAKTVDIVPQQPAAERLKAVQKPIATEAPQSVQVKPTPVEKMVKHFAQVLRTAEIVPYVPTAPLQADTAKLPKTVKPSVEMKLHASAAGTSATARKRAAVQSAAKEVSEQLSLAEQAQMKARILDRQAAEQRANATVLSKVTTQQALNAGAVAAHSKANELLANIAKLEDQAERAQVRSAALHSKAKLETAEASELMAVADRALNHKRQ